MRRRAETDPAGERAALWGAGMRGRWSHARTRGDLLRLRFTQRHDLGGPLGVAHDCALLQVQPRLERPQLGPRQPVPVGAGPAAAPGRPGAVVWLFVADGWRGVLLP